MTVNTRQMELYERDATEPRRRRTIRRMEPVVLRCAECRAKEARYGFEYEEGLDRPRTLCFECFRRAIVRRQAFAGRLARSWNAVQVELPLSERLYQGRVRRSLARIAAR